MDARAGPGTKSMTKFKSRNHNRPKPKRKSQDEDGDEPVRKKKPRKHREASPAHSDDVPGMLTILYLFDFRRYMIVIKQNMLSFHVVFL